MASVSDTNAELIAKSEALKKVHDHNRDFLSCKITLPLGDPALKKVHTNQWLFTELPKEFDLANWTILAEALNANTNRYEGYIENRWYIEGVNISVDVDGKAEMSLDLNAFASSYNSYSEAVRNMQSSYTQAVEKKTSASQNTSNAVTTTEQTKNAIKKSQYDTLNKLVAKLIKGKTTELAKAKAIHEWLQSHVHYGGYNCSKYSNPMSCYNHRNYLNCADTSRLTRQLMDIAGLNAYIVHRVGAISGNGHFWTVIEIDGKKYVSDATSSSSGWNQLWYSSGNRRTVSGNRGGNWDRKNGKAPDC